MKTDLNAFAKQRNPGVAALRARGFTLPELMTVMVILTLLVAATLSTQLWGMRMYRISESKLGITADARTVLNHIRNEIRSAKIIYVGNGSSATFTVAGNNSPQVGNAARIFPTTDTNTFVYYYMDSSDSTLKRMTSGANGVQVIAQCVTNPVVFQAEDFQGNILTNWQNNRVIRATLQFNRQEYFSSLSSNGVMCARYQLQTCIARRTD